MNAITKEFTEAIEKQLSKLDLGVQTALKKAQTIDCIVQDIEQKLARRPGDDTSFADSWGRQVASSEQVKEFADYRETHPGRVRIDLKEITSGAASGGSLARPHYDPNVNLLAGRLPRVRDLLTVINTESGSVDYVEQTTRDNQAAPQAEGALKAESDYAFELKNLAIRTIAHWTKASVQVLDDAPQLASIIDQELRYGLQLAEETQILNGSGVSPNLDGLITNATAYAAEFAPAGETMIDKIGLGMLQVSLAHYVPNGVIVNPADWMRMRLLKDTDGKYLLGDPQDAVAPNLFGIPLVPTTAMAVDKFLIGDFRAAATLYDRQSPTVQLSTEDGDNFIKNMVTIRAEERLALAVKNAGALSYGDFGNIA